MFLTVFFIYGTYLSVLDLVDRDTLLVSGKIIAVRDNGHLFVKSKSIVFENGLRVGVYNNYYIFGGQVEKATDYIKTGNDYQITFTKHSKLVQNIERISK